MNSDLTNEDQYGCYFVVLRDSCYRVLYSAQITFYPEDKGYALAYWRVRETFTFDSEFDVR